MAKRIKICLKNGENFIIKQTEEITYEKIHNKIFCYFRASHAAGVHAVLHRAVYHGHWAFVYEVHRHYERKVGRA